MDQTHPTPSPTVNITYETLFDLLRVEKQRDEIQSLSATFYLDVVEYLKKKEEILKKKQHESDIRDADELKKLKIQIENVHKLVRDLFERRMKKILDMAQNKSRTQSEIITSKGLLPEEIVFYRRVLSLLDITRGGILNRLLHLEVPKLVFEDQSQDEQKPKVEVPREIQGNILIRFTRPVPSFLDPSLQTHGPFLEQDLANLPTLVADLLIKKGRAERV